MNARFLRINYFVVQERVYVGHDKILEQH